MGIATIESPDTRQFPRWLLWVIVFSLILLGLYAGWRIGIRRAIARELAAMKAEGYPTTLKERDAWYAYPPMGKANAATKILAAAGMIQSEDKVFGDEKVDARPWIVAGLYEPWEPVDMGQPVMVEKHKLAWWLVPQFFHVMPEIPTWSVVMIEQYLEPNQPAIARLVEAAKIFDARYPADFSRNPMAGVPGAGVVRKASMLLCMEALSAIERGDADHAIEMIEASAGVAGSLRDVPGCLEQLVCCICLGMTVNMSERLVSRVKLTDAQMQRLSTALDGARDQLGLERAMAGEAAAMGEVLRHFEQYEQVNWVKRIWLRGSGIADLEYLYGLRTMHQVVSVTKMPAQQQMGQMQKIIAQLNAEPRFNTLGISMISVYTDAVLRNLRVQSRLRAAVVALGVERYRLEHGGVTPTHWEELMPVYMNESSIHDPFTGELLFMRANEDSVLVYSVGEDLTDNGGVRVNSAGREYEAGADIPFVIRPRK